MCNIYFKQLIPKNCMHGCLQAALLIFQNKLKTRNYFYYSEIFSPFRRSRMHERNDTRAMIMTEMTTKSNDKDNDKMAHKYTEKSTSYYWQSRQVTRQDSDVNSMVAK